ncbi:DUF2207 domain-containing protein [Paramicrobacterium agarici]|uniref:Putative membrane protein DUF2207 n=1 Tax=Paramicrobacterium agarici TaxID=630514 RepID=A0A2A9DRQ0_9MICO|nr:DUF2207 domain-containing protein [Microbacterium agarici]PFG29348.1 putative membrane protein DUF2207 [Microbacterium agarici]
MGRIARALVATGAAAAAAAMLTGAAMAGTVPTDERPGEPTSLNHATAAAQPNGTSPVMALGVAPSDVDDFEFQSLDVDYTIGRDDDGHSTLTVVEEFTAVFPDADQNRGMRRSIPTTYNGQPLNPELVSITDGAGTERPAETDTEDGTFQMTSRADDYLHGAQTFVFTYTLQHVTWYFDETDTEEFYWDVNGVDWKQPFGSIEATLHVPASLAPAMTAEQSCYRGAQGSADTCSILATPDADGGATVTAHARDISPYETTSIAVGFEPGTFVPYDTSFFARAWGWLQLVVTLAAVALLIPAIHTRVTKLRDAPGRPRVIAEYEPPHDIDALQAAVFLGKQAKAIPAEVLEQAVSGSIRIIEGRRKFFGGARLQAQLVDTSKADGDGRMLLYGLFGPAPAAGAVFEFGRQDKRLSKTAQNIITWAKTQLKSREYRRTVSSTAVKAPAILGFLAAGASVALGVISLNLQVEPLLPVLLMIGAVVAWVACIMLVAHRPLTPRGAELRDHLAGLKEFIEWAEADRIRMLQSPTGAERRTIDASDPRQVLHLYEKLLPFAVIFGQEKQWADQLVVLYQYTGAAAPTWYYGAAGFNASAFSSGISTLSTTAVSASSSTGGSSGGGSAGGGGGGGGGGGV